MTIRAVLFDSGHTLAHPVGGRWFPYPGFFDIASKHGHEVKDGPKLKSAHKKVMEYLTENHHVQTLEDEKAQQVDAHKILFDELGIEPSDDLLDELAHEAVHAMNMELYDDTRPVLEKLHERGLPIGVITDAWPSVEERYRQLGVRDLIHVFVVSSQHGFIKPDPRLFRPAVEGLGMPPTNILFVDDSPDIVEAAMGLGFKSVLMMRDGVNGKHRHLRKIGALEELFDLL
jgi:putative hydrolase of the HAD superfamily